MLSLWKKRRKHPVYAFLEGKKVRKKEKRLPKSKEAAELMPVSNTKPALNSKSLDKQLTGSPPARSPCKHTSTKPRNVCR